MIILALLVSVQFISVQAQVDSDNDGISDVKESEVANLYIPALQFKSGENFFPVNVGYHVENAVLKLRSGENVDILDPAPSLGTIGTYMEENYFLDNELGFIEIVSDYGQKREALGYTVYARVVGESNTIVVQYWLFYAYNDGPLNQHEGDWEMIEIILDVSDNPVSAVYSQHLGGQKALWADVEKIDGTHPVVYVALGSHANFFRSYQGRLGLENDEVGSDGITLTTVDLNLIILGERGTGNHPSSQNWLDFGGRWGDWAELADSTVGFVGPHGPGYSENLEKWFYPRVWGESVTAVDGTWFMLSWFAANFLLVFVGVNAILGVLKLWTVVKVKKEGRSMLSSILASKASIGVIFGALGIVMTIAGMLLPWYSVQAVIKTAELSIGETAELLVVGGLKGVQINFLGGGEAGLSQAFGLRVPIGILLLPGIIFSVLDLAGVEKSKSLGNKYIRSGAFFLTLVVVLLVFVSQLTSILPNLVRSVGTDLPPEALEIANTVAQKPLQGKGTYQLGDIGSVYITWGLSLGTYLFTAAALTKIIGGVILRRIDTHVQ